MHRIQSSGYGTDSNGKNYFKSTPLPPTVISAEWLQAVQEEICSVIEHTGLPVHDKDGDSVHEDLLQALLILGRPQDLVISSQATWNNAIERTGANAYRFKTGYRSIYVKYIIGGYSMISGSGPLSGGDTYGVLSLNEVTNLQFESGAYINVGDTPGYVNVATANAVLDNVYIKGTGAVEAGVQYSFLTAADRVTYRNCWTSNRYTNVDFAAFAGGSYRSSKFEGCKVYSIDCNTAAKIIRAFYQCYNVNTAYIEDITIANGIIQLIDTCYNISNSIIYNVSGIQGIVGIYASRNISVCEISTISNTTSTIYGLSTCNNISAVHVTDLVGTSASNCYGFFTCFSVTGCKATAISVNAAGGAAAGYNACQAISGCRASVIDGLQTANAYGFSNSASVTGCYVDDIDTVNGPAVGFSNCSRIAGCEATNIDTTGGTANGFSNCTYMAAMYTDEAANATCDFVDTTDAQVANKVSCPAVFT